MESRAVAVTFFLLLAVLGLLGCLSLYNVSTRPGGWDTPVLRREGVCELEMEPYEGKLWTKEGETEGRTCLLQTERLRVDFHQRRLPDGTLVKDWLWIDYGDRVNVLVRSPEGAFYVFEQTKYALPGPSLAVVGGFIEPGEKPLEAAEREVLEEMHLHCDRYEVLGRFVTDVNRGLGWVNAFLAEDCVVAAKRKASDDQERQKFRLLGMDDLRRNAREGAFIEVQWSNTVALALLYLDERSRTAG